MELETQAIETGSAEDLGGDQSGVQTPAAVVQTPATPAAPAAPDPMKAAMAELAQTMKGLATPKTVERQPTKEEIDEFWGVYNPEKTNPDFFKKWMRLQADMDPNEAQTSIAERKALFAEMQQGLVKQSLIGSRNLMQQELAKIREEFAPMNDYVSQQRAEATRSRFFESYPALATKTEEGKLQFASLIDATARVLSDRKDFQNEEQYFKALAESAAGTIKGVLPTFDLGAKPQPKSAMTSPRLNRSSAGGTGGSGGGGGATSKKGKSDDDSDSIQW